MNSRIGWFLLALATLAIGAAAHAQEVREGDLNGLGIARKQYLRAAEKQGRTDWPDPIEGSPGTQARLTFDPNNADLTLLTAKEFGLDRLLAQSKQVAATLKLPETDFITLNSRRSAGVDLEFNDYLQRERFRRGFELDLSQLRRALEATDLPEPVVLAIDADGATRVVVQSASAQRVIKDTAFLGLQEISNGDVLRFEATATPAGLVFGGLFGLIILAPIAMLFRLRKKEEPQPVPAAVEPASPEEVQKRYDRSPPSWIFPASLLVVPVLMFATRGLGNEAMTSWSILLPFSITTLMMGFAGVTAIGMLGSAFYRRLQAKRKPAEDIADGAAAAPVEEVDANLRGFGSMGIVMMAGMLVMGGLVILPIRDPEMMFWRPRIAIGLAILFAIVLAILAFRIFRSVREELRDGPWHEMVHDMARICGVIVKHVVLTKAKAPNAYASIWGTVGLTSGLIEKLEPEEVRAAVAHELAHLKLGHPRRTFALSLLTTFGFLGIAWWIRAQFGEQLPLEARALLQGPFFVIFFLPILKMLLIGRGMRGREHEADRLAVEWTGEPETLIRALHKIHYYAETPGKLKPADEVLATHPSLVRRIELLRSSSQGSLENAP